MPQTGRKRGGSRKVGLFPITADLAARAVIAAAISYGDDPVLAMTSNANIHRRSRTAAAVALSETSGWGLDVAARILGMRTAGLHNARWRPIAGYAKAVRAAEEAILWARTVRSLEDIRPKPAPAPAPVSRTAPTTRLDPPPASPATPASSLPPSRAESRELCALIRADRPKPPAQARPVSLPSVPVSPPPARSGSRTAGRPAPRDTPPGPRRQLVGDSRSGPPATRGEHPGDALAQRLERKAVREKRAAGVPWPHVARQLGVSEPTLRARYDPDYPRGATPVQATEAQTREERPS